MPFFRSSAYRFHIVIYFPVGQQEGKAIAGAVGRLRDHEDATEEAEADQEEKEKGSQRAAKVSFRQGLRVEGSVCDADDYNVMIL